MRQFFRWEYLLCKRFFRRKSFLVLLLLLPLMGLLIRAGSREKSGILEIGIVAEEKEGKSGFNRREPVAKRVRAALPQRKE